MTATIPETSGLTGQMLIAGSPVRARGVNSTRTSTTWSRGRYALAGEGLAVGRDSADPVSTEYGPGFAFTGGRIFKVTCDVGDDAYVDLERRLGAILARD